MSITLLAGYSARAARAAGLISTAADGWAASFSISDLLDAGFTLTDLRLNGFDARQLALATEQMGLSSKQFKMAGYTPRELYEAGLLPDAKAARESGFTAVQAKEGGFSVPSLVVITI